ncbi:gluconokinase [Nocardia amikacinitolerans]|uniref:gluconokinase n=1 Tax=Nocardia amikacinitolerans TaxID=756689 RepID=UPI0008340C07|nr:gluconokinase [Nocardia amikacinitolerans]
MGVSGSGKSTVAGMLSAALGWELVEGDDLHPAANIAKMADGEPLTDSDRWPWLARIAQWIEVQVRAGRSGIVTCSALKRSYRDVLRSAVPGRTGSIVTFIHLIGTREQLHRRLITRLDHFMPAGLLDSQLRTLEDPTPDEQVAEIGIDAPPDQIARAALAALRLRGRLSA